MEGYWGGGGKSRSLVDAYDALHGKPETPEVEIIFTGGPLDGGRGYHSVGLTKETSGVIFQTEKIKNNKEAALNLATWILEAIDE